MSKERLLKILHEFHEDNNWLCYEYDGAERWEFKTKPIKPNELRNYTKVNGGSWDSLSEINTRG